jgi:hypothetical protein
LLRKSLGAVDLCSDPNSFEGHGHHNFPGQVRIIKLIVICAGGAVDIVFGVSPPVSFETGDESCRFKNRA